MMPDKDYPHPMGLHVTENREREARASLAAPNGSLLDAAKQAAKWMRWWLDQDECDCEGDHQCGKPERHRELEALELEITKAENDQAQR